jgi:hypothetical protein
MARCENCGKEDKSSTATLCPSCAYHKKKQDARPADETKGRVATPKDPDRPDMDELRERLRRVREGLTE